MSADSPRRGVHKGAQVVSPQPIVDRSIIDSVAGIINDIVPQAYAGTPNADNKETISWARFEYADVNDPALYPDYNEGSSTPPLLLVLGYTTGVQVWLIAATGEATEVLSWRQGVVRTLRILPNPKTDDEHIDLFASKRPMIAICDSSGPGPQFCNISFASLKTGEQAKSIKFKNPVCDVLANTRSIVVTFLEKIAVFDARTLEDVLTVTTCYASPGPNPNPVALGTRWLAYSEKKLIPAKRSSGGCEGDGVQSYTATVLYAAKSLGKGLRGLGETVASSLTGNSVSPVAINNTANGVTQPGVITILDLQAAKEEKELDDANIETVIAHFTAHSDAIVAMTFDLSGALLMTADKRGHDFHVFRIQPHPGGPTLAAVHHLYILHRGDTTAKVQDMVFSSDTRWAAISTVRGTTHVFPVAPYGGPVGVRTHSTPHVVNRLSRFHRSAGLTDDGTRSHSPVSHSEIPLSVYPYSNPRLPPYPHPTILHPLAQIRQPSTLNHVNSQIQQSRPQQRQRLHSDDSGTLPLKICACFAPPRAWMFAQRESTTKVVKRAVDSLFIMACHGNMIQYDLEPKPAAGVPKEKVCDDTMIELELEAKGQWPLQRSPNSAEIVPPLPSSSLLLSIISLPKDDAQEVDTAEDRWLSQVEIVTHAGPHRRLWMGPQFVFKTYNASSGVAVNLVEAEAIEIGVTGGSRPARSNPVNMPHAASRSLMPVVIDGSGSSYEQSPRFMEAYGDSLHCENVGIGSGENQLREDLAEAMLETSIAPHRAPGRRTVFERVGQPVTKVVNPLGTVITVSADEEDVDSSQEFDTGEDSNVPEAPRSVCAEEGPASLGDLEPDSQILPDLTEICAEMRSASEPAIDNIPDEDIREVKERKSLCVEAASILNPGCSSIDFEKEEAFRDVPTKLSLCVEQGEIPSSPMTQAKETVWCKGLGKRAEAGMHARNLPEAQYVVNCDDDSVVLMENKPTRAQKNLTENSKDDNSNSSATGKATKKSSRSHSTVDALPSVASADGRTKKYISKEEGDSVIIEGTHEDSKSTAHKRKGCTEKNTHKDIKTKNAECKVQDSLKESAAVKSKNKSKPAVVQEPSQKCLKAKVDCTGPKNLEKRVESIAEVQSSETVVSEKVDKKEDLLSKENSDVADESTEKDKSLDLEGPFDDFSSVEYHMIEATSCNKDGNYSNQSDEDIEHIQTSEISQINQAECIDSDKCTEITSCAESSPMLHRKNSKNTISDDDLEYIHTSELAETSDGRNSKEDLKFVITENVSELDLLTAARSSKNVLSSDDDLEHIQHSDVCMLSPETIIVKGNREKLIKKSQESLSEQGLKSKYSKNVKDVVVIEEDTCTANVTVVVKPHEGWGRNKSTEKKVTAELDESVKLKETTSNEPDPSPTKKVKAVTSKSISTIPPKRSQTGSIEIIDIDAMQKAEMEVLTDATLTPECKILSGPHEVCGTRAKKSRKNKKSNSEANVSGVTEASSSSKTMELQDTVKPEFQDPTVAISWSAVIKKKSGSPTDLEVSKKVDPKHFLENDEKLDSLEKLKSASPVEKIESVRRRKRNSSSEKALDLGNVNMQPQISAVPSSLFRSSVMIDELHEAVTESDTDKKWHEPKPVDVEPSWSSIVKKRSIVPNEFDVEKQSESEPPVGEIKELDIIRKETKNRRKRDFSNEKVDPETVDTDLHAKSVVFNPAAETLVSEESSTNLMAVKKVAKDVPIDEKDKPIDEEPPSVELASSKEDSSEQERDADLEKRSDSEQEMVPERSSSSDDLNANVAFTNTEEDCAVRGAVLESNVNGASSAACISSKKGSRSKKKKRR